ncbi:hypothetical protein BV53_05980 [Candidatus Synechococcus spongiarum LMB bulk15N]|uniref:Uncharacterized protein n=2 Tax=Candidatus Synechococcus spongiarum TaxID=431041 RepID=A0A1T1D0I2_9SYNE|nr:hypothetical protein BV53_05980 [Candidatus Synechococcus spongiarum LMB bulk15N]
MYEPPAFPPITRTPMPNPLPHQRSSVCPQPLGLWAVVMATCLVTIHPAQAQQPVRPLPYHSRCPVGYVASGSYCLPAKGGKPRGALVKVGRVCPQGFTSWGNYCLSTTNNRREAMQKVGDTCPQGWSASQNYCMVATGNKRREVITRVDRGCPTGFTPWGDYCLGYPNQEREAVLRVGRLCPPGWPRFGTYCLQTAE